MSKQRPTTWVCGACGKTADDRYSFNDVSCAVNAVLVYKDTLKYKKERVVYADAVRNPNE